MTQARSHFILFLLVTIISPGCEGKKNATDHLILAFENGKSTWRTEDIADSRGLTTIDLSDDWAPYVFSQQDSNNHQITINKARQLYTKLANAEALASPTMTQAQRQLSKRANADIQPTGDSFLEVYGISPSISQIKNRAKQVVSESCFDNVGLDSIRRFSGLIEYENNRVAQLRSETGFHDAKRLRQEMTRLELTNPLQVPGNFENAIAYEALVEIQKQLVCEDLLSAGSYVKGGLDSNTHRAVAAFERKNGILGFGQVAGITLKTLQKTTAERLHETFKRALTERVIDAASVIGDELAIELTNAVLAEMGISTPENTFEFLQNTSEETLRNLRIAAHLPALPAHYQQRMDLTVEIDRGDVWYDFPFADDGKTILQPRKFKPTLTLFANSNGQKIPLVTVPTTIGGWQNEMSPEGKQILRYKNSTPGQGAWNKIVAGPVWIPPSTTPPKELIKEVRYAGRYVNVVDYDQIGPWYASAYGLAAAFHVSLAGTDEGIRTHGTHDYNAIYNRYSHGCHRLPNNLAIRLLSFVLKHTPHKRIGHIENRATVSIDHEGRPYSIRINDRGYTYELVNPIPVTILPGRILGESKTPLQSSQVRN